MLPYFFTAMHLYFEKKRNFAMGITQALCILSIMLCPTFISYLMDKFDFRGTVAIISAISLKCLLAALTLQPVEKHMKKRKLSEVPVAEEKKEVEYTKVDVEEKLLDDKENGEEQESCVIIRKPRPSIISIGGLAASVGSNLNTLHNDEKKEYLTKW